MIDKYQALSKYLAERASVPFEWGANDCCIFAADWVLAATGRDYAADLRGTYSDPIRAGANLRKLGGPARIATDALGIALPHVATAQRGDVILFESGAGPALGICVGEKFAAIPPEGGVKYYAMRHAVTAWRLA